MGGCPRSRSRRSKLYRPQVAETQLGSRGVSLAELGELLAAAQPSDAAETQLAERFAALLDLWTQDEILTQPSPSDASACSRAHA